MSWPRVLPCVLVLVVVTSCTAPIKKFTSVCEFVRYSVKAGEMPLDLARQHYPECKAEQEQRK